MNKILSLLPQGVALLAYAVFSLAYAQNDAACKVLSWAVLLIGQGPIISAIISLLKGLGLLEKYPKLASLVLNLIAGLAAGFTLCGLDIGQIILQIIAGLAGAELTYQWVSKPLRNQLNPAPAALERERPYLERERP